VSPEISYSLIYGEKWTQALYKISPYRDMYLFKISHHKKWFSPELINISKKGGREILFVLSSGKITANTSFLWVFSD
jgi:hypothetical protein